MILLGQVASSHTSSASSSSQGGVNAEELVKKMKLLTSGVREFT